MARKGSDGLLSDDEEVLSDDDERPIDQHVKVSRKRVSPGLPKELRQSRDVQ